MPADPIVLSFHDSLLRQSDVLLIQNNEWLNDSVIAFWFEYLDRVRYQDVRSRVSFIGPEVTQLIKSAESSSSATKPVVASIIESMSLTEKDLILLPINDHSSTSMTAGGSHWTLIAITRNDSNTFTFTHLDSMDSDHNRFPAHQIFSVLKNSIEFYPHAVVDINCTRQVNSYDCGIHVMANADAVCQQKLRNNSRELTEIADKQSIHELRLFLPLLIIELSQKSLLKEGREKVINTHE